MAKPTTPAQGRTEDVTADLYEQPGHLIRRAQQIAVGMFTQHVGKDVTPIQYAALRMVQEKPGIDQMGLAKCIALDTSTAAMVAARLEAKGLLTRSVVTGNRRQLKLVLTAEGEALLRGLVSGVHTMREQLLSSLDPQEQKQFMHLLRKFVQLNNDQSRAPLQLGVPPPAPIAAPVARRQKRTPPGAATPVRRPPK